jgi:hypothetical protein
MRDLLQTNTKYRAQRKAMGFTMSKLQTIACLAASFGLGIGIIFWGS